MIQTKKRSLTRKILGGLAGLVLSTAGCVTGGSVGVSVGYNMPTSQKSDIAVYDNSIVSGVRGRVKTDSDIELEFAYSGHETNWTDGFSNEDLEAKDLSVSASYPLFKNDKFSVNASAGVIIRNETFTGEIIGVPGSYGENTNSTGWKAGVEARYTPTKNVSVEADLDVHGFDNSYEKSGTTLSVGASYNF